MPPRVYVVDDDALVTTSLSTILGLETDWRVHAFNDAPSALAAMEGEPPDVVLSDLKMPGMDGIAFLKRVRALHPEAVLLLLTGYADKESAVQAINEVGIWQYVEKPWNTNDLLLKVRQGLERRDLVVRLTEANRELRGRLEELESAREQLVQSERLAAVGRVMSGLTHELGNQLSLMGYADLILDRTQDPEVADYARQILAGQKRLGAMIAEIKDFARGGRTDYQREPADLAALVEEVASILRFDAEVKTRGVRVEARARPIARVHRGKLIQAIVNLVRNAAQASPEGAEVRVVVEETDGPSGPDDTAGRVARVRVIDRGAGIPEEVVARLGEPFFTTKDHGTGLGLGISRRIVEEHGGRLEIRSRVGEGTEVEIRLPVVAGAA